MKRKPSFLRGLLTGAAAGLAGSLTMAGFQEFVAKGSSLGNHDAPHAHAPQPGQENTTETTARKLMTQFGRSSPNSEKQVAGRALHYGFGLTMGAVYGVISEYLPIVGLGAGTAFGTILFAATDEAALPLLKLASQPADTPPLEHLLHWASHVVYASTLEITRKQLVRLT
ncbi:MAG: DUF1440 domain-containing protein [Janthinobacterium lividum]